MAARGEKRVEVVLQQGMRFEARDEAGHTLALESTRDGPGAGPTPMVMLLMSLGGCTALDVISILRKKRQQVTAYTVEVSGIQAEEHPRVFTEITVRHIVTGHDIAEPAVEQAIALSEEKYCSVSAMLSSVATIRHEHEIRQAEGPPRD